ncbi:protein FAM13C-like [Suncus etruscus]|uniref:protein FAM13C-like n=1 Tax=Suncus etruscus TaxID=109475 RepID=UPI00210FFE42|nr:protein FAM13C-like [Suncus etruscus]
MTTTPTSPKLQLQEEMMETVSSSILGNTESLETGSILKPEAEEILKGESQETEYVLSSHIECEKSAEMPAPEEPHCYIFGSQEARIDENAAQSAATWRWDVFESQKNLNEEAPWGYGVKDPAPVASWGAVAERAEGDDAASAAKDKQEDAHSLLTDLQPHEKSSLLSHISGGDKPLLSQQCSTFSQSQSFISDPESAPFPPSFYHSMMASRFSQHSSGNGKEPVNITQLTKQIQSLKQRIKKFEEKFEQEKKYRPSHGDKISNSKVRKWMNELEKNCKQLKELKLKMMLEKQGSAMKGLSRSLYAEYPKGPQEKEMPQTMDTKPSSFRAGASCPQRRELSPKKGIQETKEVRKPSATYSRHRVSKSAFARRSVIPTIQEEDSEDNCAQGSQPSPLPDQLLHLNVGDCQGSSKESEPFKILQPEENKEIKPPTISMSVLHEATLPVLLDQFREAKAEKRRLQRVIKGFDDGVSKQAGINPPKERRRPLSAEYLEYKAIKARLKLLEALISKKDKDQAM